MKQNRIWICGCGAIGSRIGYELCMTFKYFTLFDDGRIEPEKLAASIYPDDLISCNKAFGLGHMIHVRGQAQAEPWKETLTQDLVLKILAREKPVLIIDALDNPRARNLLHNLGVPTLHISVNETQTGTVIWDENWQIQDTDWEGYYFYTYTLGLPLIRMAVHTALLSIEHYMNDGRKAEYSFGPEEIIAL